MDTKKTMAIRGSMILWILPLVLLISTTVLNQVHGARVLKKGEFEAGRYFKRLLSGTLTESEGVIRVNGAATPASSETNTAHAPEAPSPTNSIVTPQHSPSSSDSNPSRPAIPRVHIFPRPFPVDPIPHYIPHPFPFHIHPQFMPNSMRHDEMNQQVLQQHDEVITEANGMKNAVPHAHAFPATQAWPHPLPAALHPHPLVSSSHGLPNVLPTSHIPHPVVPPFHPHPLLHPFHHPYIVPHPAHSASSTSPPSTSPAASSSDPSTPSPSPSATPSSSSSSSSSSP